MPENHEINPGSNTPPSNSNKEASNKKTQNPTGKLLVEMVVCIFIPTLILKKLSGPESLGPTFAFLLAISLPFSMAIFDFIKARKIGFVSAIGFISILLTGSIGLLKLPKEYIAYKEALIPAIFAIAAYISTKTSKPLVRLFLYNDVLMKTDLVAEKLQDRNNTDQFDLVMKNATLILTASFALSAILNYILAKIIIVSETGTEAFNEELGTMNLLTYPVIVLPMMVFSMYALFYVIKNIHQLTGLEFEEVINV